MCNFIGIEYLVALALIINNKEEISLAELNEYGVKITKVIKDRKINAVFLFSSKYAIEMVRNYSDCFEWKEEESVLRRKKNVSNDDLISKFLDYLSTDVLLAAQATKGANAA